MLSAPSALPHTIKLVKMAELFHCTADYLLGINVKQPPPAGRRESA